MNIVVAIIGILILSAFLFASMPAKSLAQFARSGLPIFLGVGGIGLLLTKQGLLGSLMIFAAIRLWRFNRQTQPIAPAGGNARWSTVRSAALEMELDHDSGEMNGVVLAGQFVGQTLNDLDLAELLILRKEISDDGESLALLDAYLDGRFAAWREDAEPNAGAGEARSTGSGTMSEQEAYEVLGLAAGASVDDIRLAHRRLMKSAHPDSGGSTFLASKINEAKDVLLRSHS